ncbi:MAG: binding-protein-dependent transport system inner rane component [Polyangiaceae bacterium]|jgi:multiple sugar transport system permease protein|nr:binding-protein-dependent transport system inner rane component [Polyangiaceae bacterium]
MASPNPLQRTTPIVHLPLLILAALFLGPMIWLFATSLQPREQVGKVPPEVLPRQYYVVLGTEHVTVTPPQPIGAPKLLVAPAAGPHQGQQILVDPQQFRDGKLTEQVRVADREEPRVFAAELLRTVAATDVVVKEWLLSKYSKQEPRVFYLAAADVKSKVSPVFGNYPEAIKALTSGEKDKARPLSELLGLSTFPWTKEGTVGRTITFLTYLSNTLLVGVLGVTGTVLSSAFVAYGLSRVQWKGRETLFTITLSTMMVPFPVLMIPLYSVFRAMGWLGTLMPLWVPAFFGSAFNIFLLRQFFLTIPSELSEAARIDGCSEFTIFWRVILPLARPALSVVALFHFLFVWNDFLGPLVFLTKPETFTMALGLQQYQSQNGGSEQHLLMAASSLLLLPIVVLFFFAQKTFIQGISTTGMGGR